MSDTPLKKGIYPGWWIVVTSLLLMAVLFASTINLPGLFTTYVSEEFGVSRTAFTTHVTIATLSSMVAAMMVGKVMQRFNIKLVMTIFTLIAAACFTGYSFATALWHFYVISAVVGFCLMFLTSVPISILITTWFGPKMKGKAMGIAMTGSGLGAMILSPILTFINSTYGWRMSYRLIALLVVAVILPMVLLTISPSPAAKGVARLGDDPNAPPAGAAGAHAVGLTAGQALGSSLFWVMFLTFFLFSMTTTLFNVNAVPYLTDLGMDPVRAAAMLSVSSFGVIIGKLTLGGICDKWSAKFGSTCAISCLILALVLLLSLPKFLVLAPIATFIFGLGNANATVTMPLITNDLVGNRDFGAIFGYANIASSLGAGVGPLFGAMVFDATGSYAAAWSSDIGLMLGMVLLLHLCYRLKPRVYSKLEAKSKA